jgi:hypothetical protein
MLRWNALGNPMTTHLSSHARMILSVAGLVSIIFSAATRAAPEGPKLDSKNFEVLGIRLGGSEIGDVERILGPAPVRQAIHIEEASRCYASRANDWTILEFDNWLTNVVEFRIYQGSPQSINQCAKSSLVSNSLSTASGLKLGMSRREVVALLGPPSKMEGDDLIYESSSDRPPTPEEVKRFNDGFSTPPSLINIYERIDLEIRRSKLVRVDVARGEDW